MPVVKATTILFKAGMMITAKPTFVVLVAATIFLTISGPLPLRWLVLLTTGLLLVLLLTLGPLLICRLGLLLLLVRRLGLLLLFLLLLLLTLGLLLLMLICRLGLLFLLLLLLFLLTLGLMLFLFGRLGFLLLFRLGLLLLFFGFCFLLVLLLLCIRGSNGSEHQEQNSRADESDWFHVCYLRFPASGSSFLLHRVPLFSDS